MDVDEAPNEAPVSTEKQSKESRRENRPKKRRKLSVPPEDIDDKPIEEGEEESAEHDEAESKAHRTEVLDPSRSPSPAAVLLSFPLPSFPDTPTESALALQGLDQALMDAEVVDPSTTLSISQQSTRTGLGDKMQKRLQELGITELFAVQTALLPFLLPSNPWQKSLYQPYSPSRDVCVSAPTGSGKTLAYVVPIVEVLSSRIVTRLRALVVLPTRDLVTQVRETFEAISKGRGLKIGTATGQHSFAQEQSQLVADRTSSLLGGSSKVDILICTPGRLIDHLVETPNFSLQHLRFLVIDEADRLLAQSYQNWLTQILAATRPPKPSTHYCVEDLLNGSEGELTPPSCVKHDALNPAFMHLLPYPDVPSFFPERKETSCQKLLFSATLTRDPAKLALLELRDPKYFVVHRRPGKPGTLDNSVLDVVTERFTFPDTLKEHMVVCETAKKPLMLFHLIHQHNISNAIIFTKSAESTARLVQLFEFFEQSRTGTGRATNESGKPPISVRAYSSDLGASERKSILNSFRDQEIQILVCSDIIARGIDISHVSHIISYDAPVDMRKYVHRVGRTARAGKDGEAWTLVEEQEARHFKTMMKSANHLDKVKRKRVKEQDLGPLAPYYESALTQLKDVYSRK
ncbi:DEAD-domain-containing protein [Marasmius fiardii PR-910]|nr:DEAD-domain-containing protein [Marasmius fiardii PR-910]